MNSFRSERADADHGAFSGPALPHVAASSSYPRVRTVPATVPRPRWRCLRVCPALRAGSADDNADARCTPKGWERIAVYAQEMRKRREGTSPLLTRRLDLLRKRPRPSPDPGHTPDDPDGPDDPSTALAVTRDCGASPLDHYATRQIRRVA